MKNKKNSSFPKYDVKKVNTIAKEKGCPCNKRIAFHRKIGKKS